MQCHFIISLHSAWQQSKVTWQQWYSHPWHWLAKFPSGAHHCVIILTVVSCHGSSKSVSLIRNNLNVSWVTSTPNQTFPAGLLRLSLWKCCRYAQALRGKEGSFWFEVHLSLKNIGTNLRRPSRRSLMMAGSKLVRKKTHWEQRVLLIIAIIWFGKKLHISLSRHDFQLVCIRSAVLVARVYTLNMCVNSMCTCSDFWGIVREW